MYAVHRYSISAYRTIVAVVFVVFERIPHTFGIIEFVKAVYSNVVFGQHFAAVRFYGVHCKIVLGVDADIENVFGGCDITAVGYTVVFVFTVADIEFGVLTYPRAVRSEIKNRIITVEVVDFPFAIYAV